MWLSQELNLGLSIYIYIIELVYREVLLKPYANGWNNWELLLLHILDGVGSCVRTDATNPNNVRMCVVLWEGYDS